MTWSSAMALVPAKMSRSRRLLAKRSPSWPDLHPLPTTPKNLVNTHHILHGELVVLVDVDLGQVDVIPKRLQRGLQAGSQLLAGPTPPGEIAGADMVGTSRGGAHRLMVSTSE